MREKTEQLIEYALERAEQVRRQADPPLHNLSTHIKSMRVADFFQLSKDEAVGKVLTDLLGRLRILGGLADITDPDSDAAEGDVAGCSDQQRAEASRVMAGAMEAEDAASGPSTAAQELPQLQQGQGQAGAGCCGPSAMEVDRKTDAELMPPPPPPQTAARRGGNATAANGASTAAAAGAGAQHQAPFTVGRPARPPRVGDKLVYAGEQGVFSEQGGWEARCPARQQVVHALAGGQASKRLPGIGWQSRPTHGCSQNLRMLPENLIWVGNNVSIWCIMNHDMWSKRSTCRPF